MPPGPPPSVPPSNDPVSALAADLEPLLSVLVPALGSERLFLVVDPDDQEALGVSSEAQLDLSSRLAIVSEGRLADLLRGGARGGQGPRRLEDGRWLIPAGSGGLVTEPGARASLDEPAIVSLLALVACSLVRRAVALARAHEQVRQLALLSTVDPLTGLRNRRFFDRLFAQEIARRRRYQRALTVLVVDIDHFKKLNDTYGHDMGDVVLRAVAEVLRQSVRATDSAIRLGGEEFAALLPETPADGGQAVAERIRTAIAALDTDGIQVTVSVGGATATGSWPGDANTLLKAADQALYRAKREGRDRVVMVELDEWDVDPAGP